ncbi:hypothetical protein C4564_02570 [Candidatus Microgenomates bacterium]|nr:MAG: hypothetical protein C4564_02570 [Candidatus Microgenomates bacterium]
MSKLKDFINTAPLLEPESSLNGIQPELEEGSGGSLYFGTGLTTSKAPSIGVPFDVVGMLCVAKKLREVLSLNEVIQFIADTHALSNDFNTSESVKAIADKMVDASGRVARLLDMKYTPILASDIDHKPEYLEIFNSIESDDHEYVRREWTDIEYLRQQHSLRLKLSWTIGPKVNKLGFDERLYDLRFREVMGHTMSFIYLLPGRTLDIDRPKVSPYISVEGERRILLQKGEDVAGKIAEAKDTQNNKLKSAMKHLASIVALFEELQGEVPGSTTEEKVQSIIDMIFEK